MYNRLILLLPALCAAITSAVARPAPHQGFAHRQSDPSGYVWPTDSLVLDKLANWQDQKFGVLIHWGLYSLPGIVESWSICSEDVDWITRRNDLPYEEYKQWYWSLKDSLNPVSFDPGQWADVMSDAGMRYMIFTTKHHDGFCTFDSRLTDFTIAHGPFAGDPRRDIAAGVFDAFRDRGFMTGCYFSKPDWHCPWFWNPEFATPDRHINYSKARHPEWWQSYVDFTAGQLDELMTRYGSFDILWLDGGWISGDDIGLDSILVRARERHPGLISVDRAIRGRNENYQTPERGIPPAPLPYPWESCIPLSNDWGWVPDAPYKSPRRVIAMLSEIVAKGGCLALGIGPTAEGLIEDEAVWRLREIGRWLDANGEAIYSTRPVRQYGDGTGRIWFTGAPDSSAVYAIYTPGDGEPLPRTIGWRGNLPSGRMTLLDGGRRVSYRIDGDSVTVTLPRGLSEGPLALKFAPAPMPPVYKDPTAPVAERVSDLLQRMTLEEKIGQLRCPMGWEMYDRIGDEVTLSGRFIDEMSGAMAPGSFWAVLRADPWTKKTVDTGLDPRLSAEALNAMQRYAVTHSRLGIPLLFAEECPHGHMAIGATVFPTGLAMASTWNPDLLREVGEAIALEARTRGATTGYGPVLDLARDPRWSRTEETFGEDPVLTSRCGVAMVRGMQGDRPDDGTHLYSTLKHLAAYGIPGGGHNGAPASVGPRQLETEYLPPFRDAVRAGAASVMTSYNSVDGVPCTADRHLLQDLLRDSWGFGGAVFSDLYSIDGLAGSHRVARDLSEAASLSLPAGVDIDLGGAAYGEPLLRAVTSGTVPVEAVDSAVARVLRLKFRMGLFENPYVSPERAAEVSRCPAHLSLAREAARQGTVLLKNDGMLPLDRSIGSVAVIGPNADMPYNQLGDYTAPQPDGAVATLLDGIRETVSPTTRVTYVRGCAVRDTSMTDIASAVAAAENSDAVVLVIGGSSARDFRTSYLDTGAATTGVPTRDLIPDMDCGEGFDRSTLHLLGDQERLLEAVLATGRPVAVVYIQGRPLSMERAADSASALLTAWYPGGEGGRAVADILFGVCSPSGRLPVSVPRNEGQLPVYYSAGSHHDYMDGPGDALFPFGFGLSYTTFDYSDLTVAPYSTGAGEQLVSCTVTNTGTCAGREVVQLYVSRSGTSMAQPPLQLRDFCSIELSPGESRRVTFTLRDTGPGDFTIMIGHSSADLPLRGRVAASSSQGAVVHRTL